MRRAARKEARTGNHATENEGQALLGKSAAKTREEPEKQEESRQRVRECRMRKGHEDSAEKQEGRRGRLFLSHDIRVPATMWTGQRRERKTTMMSRRRETLAMCAMIEASKQVHAGERRENREARGKETQEQRTRTGIRMSDKAAASAAAAADAN